MNDRQKLYDALPQKYKTNYGWWDYDIDKDSAIDQMRGRGDAHTYDEAAKKEVGETFAKDAPNDLYMIVKKTPDKIYAIQPDVFSTMLNEVLFKFDYHERSRVYSSIRKHPIAERFIPFREEIKKIGNDVYVWRGWLSMMYDKSLDADKKRIYEEAKKLMMDSLAEYPETSLNVYSFNIKPHKVALKNTWDLFENETVYETLKKLGYDGYVAMERKYKTYAIFDPQKTITILNVEKVR
jgi:hypothetical protein